MRQQIHPRTNCWVSQSLSCRSTARSSSLVVVKSTARSGRLQPGASLGLTFQAHAAKQRTRARPISTWRCLITAPMPVVTPQPYSRFYRRRVLGRDFGKRDLGVTVCVWAKVEKPPYSGWIGVPSINRKKPRCAVGSRPDLGSRGSPDTSWFLPDKQYSHSPDLRRVKRR